MSNVVVLLEGRSVGLEEMLSVRGKKVGRKWEEKWEVLVSGKWWWWWCLWWCSSVCVSTFMQCCDCLALPAVEASLLQHARIA